MGTSQRKNPAPAPAPPGAGKAASGHSGRGASTALARMKQWERSRAALRAARGRDKPSGT